MTTAVIGQDPYIGKIAGKYRLVQRLGAGGMGAVYLAENIALPGSRYVVKVLSAEAQANEFVNQHFAVEARAAAALGHTNIIAVHDLGALDTGEPYIAMEYLVGTDVHVLVQRYGRQMPLALALQIILQASAALQCAHKAGIIHRDIKPHNLYFVDATGVVKVLDFGIAKATDPSVAGGALTKTTMVSGSPGYMSPEQASGIKNVDARGDIFSLAATLYHMVTGELPWKAESFPDYTFQLGLTKPRDPQSLRPDLPNAWKFILLQGLSVHVHERPQTIEDFALPLIVDIPTGIDIANRFARSLIERTPFFRPHEAPSTGPFTAPAPSIATGSGGGVGALASGAASGAIPLPSGTSISGAAGVVSRGTSTASPRIGPWFALGAIALAAAAITVALVVTRNGSHGGPEGSTAAVGAGSDARTAPTIDAARAAQLEPPAVDAAQLAAAPAAVDAQLAASVDAAQLAAVPVSDAGPAPTRPVDGAAPALTRPIAPAGTGSLEVYVEPWAMVQIDGRDAGQTPVTKTLTAGTHRVVLSNPDSGKQERIPVTIRTGRTTTIDRKW